MPRFGPLALALGLALAPTASPAAADRPNLVIIMADDMGYSDIGCYGGEIATPNLDALAADGLRFTQFYNGARCCPTRAALLTGLYAHQAGVGHMMERREPPAYRGDLNRSSVTIAEALKPAGYTTLMSGKWHVCRPDRAAENGPIARGFDRYYGIIHGAGSYYDPITLTRDTEVIEPENDDYYFTDAIAANAASMIADATDADRPFFLYVAFTAPHWPLQAPESAVERYEGRYAGGWDALRAERYRRMIDLGIVSDRWALSPRDPNVPPWEDASDKEWQARRMAVYAAQVELMDRGVGRVVDQLKESGVLDNTLILFLADNGGCAEEIRADWTGLHIPEATRDGRPVAIGNDPKVMPGPETTYQSYGLPWANASNTPYRLYKHWVHEGGISSPLIAHWPEGIPANLDGTLTDAPAHLIDLMATCVDLAEAEYPAEHSGHAITPLEGQSLAPILQTGSREGHEAIYWEHEGNRAVRRGKWKLVSRFREPWSLYDIDADRTEQHDLAAEHPDLVDELASLHDAWADRVGVVPWGELTRRRD